MADSLHGIGAKCMPQVWKTLGSLHVQVMPVTKNGALVATLQEPGAVSQCLDWAASCQNILTE